MDNSVAWSGFYGTVETNGVVFPIGSKPELPFEYDSLYYEPAVGNSFKILHDGQYELTEDEIASCKNFSASFFDTADYPVQALEKDTLLYMGSMMKSEAIKQGFLYTIGQIPDFPVARYVFGEGETEPSENGHWEKIVCIIKDDGFYVLNPDGICPKCVLFLNQEQLDAFPKPTKSTEIWDFATETWKDYRTLERARSGLIEYIRNMYSPKRQEIQGGYTPFTEVSSWPIQLEEAKAYKVDTTVATPFIDATLAAMGGFKTKAEFVEDILKHNSPDILAKLGALHGEQYGWITKVRAAETLDKIDALDKEFAEAMGVPTFIRPLSGF